MEVYENLPYGKVASIIEEYHDVKITDTLIEKYVELASQRKFTFDPVVFEIRKLNKFDNNLVENKLEFVLEDNSKIIISYESYDRMKELIEHNEEAIEFIKSSKENLMKFLKIINKHKED